MSLLLTFKMQQEQHNSLVKQLMRSPALGRQQQKRARMQSPALPAEEPSQSSSWK
jgi:hypothetical protein